MDSKTTCILQGTLLGVLSNGPWFMWCLFLQLKYNNLLSPCIIFFKTVDDDYGIDDDGPVPLEANSDEPIEVPLTEISLAQNLQRQLQLTIDPLRDSDCHGVDIYLAVVDFLVNVCNRM